MRSNIKGVTLIELIITVSILAITIGAITGTFLTIQYQFNNSLALVKSQATGRVVIEKLVRVLRHGQAFSVSQGGAAIEVTKDDGSVETFIFADNEITQNGNSIGENIYEIPGEDVFQDLTADELVGVRFAVINQGVFNQDRRIHISTEMKLRN